MLDFAWERFYLVQQYFFLITPFLNDREQFSEAYILSLEQIIRKTLFIFW